MKIRTWEDNLKSMVGRKKKSDIVTPSGRMPGKATKFKIEGTVTGRIAVDARVWRNPMAEKPISDAEVELLRQGVEKLANTDFSKTEERIVHMGVGERHLPTGFLTQPLFPKEVLAVKVEPNKVFGHEIGSPGYEKMIDFMRADLASGMALSQKQLAQEEWKEKLITNTRKRFEEQGRDFDAEFEKWKENK